MKNYARTLLLILAALTLESYAQTMPAQWLIYQKINSYWGAYRASEVDSVVFTDTNHDVSVYAQKGIRDDGRWYMDVRGYGELNITTTKIGVVPASYSEGTILSMLLEGKLTDLHEASVEDGTNRAEFIVDDGSYKPIIFGYDAQGNYKSYAVGEELTYATADFSELNELLLTWGYQSSRANDWGYGSLMHVRDVMGEELTIPATGYNWYDGWMSNTNLGSNYAYSAIVCYTLNKAIKGVCDIVDVYQKRSQAAEVDKVTWGTALALRAMLYLDAARMYEFLDNDAVGSVNEAGNDVSGLTYPIEPSSHWWEGFKRATREEMAAYILTDLDRAEEVLNGVPPTTKLAAGKAVVYGLKARLYLWTEDYAQARTYADKAISEGGHTPLTRAEWLDTTTGFNDSRVSSWMWAMTYTEDSEPVQSGIHNWVSWNCNEYTEGYNAVGAWTLIGKSFYDRIADTDFRKLSFKAPYGSPLYGTEPHLTDGGYEYLPDYAALKFRPGKGNTDDSQVACVVDVPLMRIEEMYFIRCEADAQLGNVAAAKAGLSSFMMQYRDVNYSTTASDQQALIDEIFLQKRIEFWGEGLNYFDYKRLNKPVTRAYAGTNFSEHARFNTTTRPAWMNFYIANYDYGVDVTPWNNPDPSDCYTPVY